MGYISGHVSRLPHLQPGGHPMSMADRNHSSATLSSHWAAGYDRECVGRDESGAGYVTLAAPAGALIDYLNGLRGALQLTCSRVAVLATTAEARISWRPGEGPMPGDERARTFFNLAEFAYVRAVKETGPLGVRHLLEIRDSRSCPGQQWLIPEAEVPGFLDFARAFQCAQDLPSAWYSPNHAASARRLQTLTHRIPWLRQLHGRGATALVRPMEPLRVEATLRRAALEGQALRTTVYNRSMFQGAVWTSEASTFDDRSGTDGARVARFRGDGVGLELNGDAAFSAWLWMGQCACCNEEKWAVELADENDELAFAIRAPEGTDEPDWRDFLKPLLEEQKV